VANVAVGVFQRRRQLRHHGRIAPLAERDASGGADVRVGVLEGGFDRGERLRILRVDGLTLEVEPETRSERR